MVFISTPIPRAVVWAAEPNSHPLHYLGHNALFCYHIPTQGSILLLCLALMTTLWLGCMAASGDMSPSCHAYRLVSAYRVKHDLLTRSRSRMCPADQVNGRCALPCCELGAALRCRVSGPMHSTNILRVQNKIALPYALLRNAHAQRTITRTDLTG